MNFLYGLMVRAHSFLLMPPDVGTAPVIPQNGGGTPVPAEAQQPGSIVPTIIMFGGMFAAMYFFLIRPQRKRDRQQKEMQSALKVGDRVVTSSGMYGKIVSVGGDAFMIEFGDIRGIRIPVR